MTSRVAFRLTVRPEMIEKSMKRAWSLVRFSMKSTRQTRARRG